MKGFFKTFPLTRGILSKESCRSCGLYKTCRSPKMNYTGKGRKKILIVGEAPGRSEDEDWERKGYKEPTQFIGDAGALFRLKLQPYGLDLDEDFWKINASNCRPPGNRKPTRKELKFCRFMLDKAIRELKPESIWLLGGAAVESFYMGRFTCCRYCM